MLRLRAGTATLLIGPRSAAGVHGGRYCLDSETDIRQRLTLALQDPASREAMRRFWAHWQSDARLAGVKDQSIVDRIARLGVRGPLIVFLVVDTSVHRRDTLGVAQQASGGSAAKPASFKPWSGPVKAPALIAVNCDHAGGGQAAGAGRSLDHPLPKRRSETGPSPKSSPRS